MMIRLFDILLSGITIIILSPLLLVIMMILRFTGEGEIFYIQQRVGHEGKLFGVYKFATMVKNSSKIGSGLITTKNDPRVLPVGKVLRKTKINEFPQLFNIFKGDMSIVGPRPQAQGHFDVFPEKVKKEIVAIKPGLTGIGSIVFRDEETILEGSTLSYEDCYNNLIAPYKGDLELWYIKNQSIFLYFTLIFITAYVVIFSKTSTPLKSFKNLPIPPEELDIQL
jgi:lipopolysaccharide/colanic/teichoic acid biosynthesis glycosyltransferase